MKKISICIATYNRDDLLFESFMNVINDPRIDEIVISDDGSDMKIYESIRDKCSQHNKIKLIRNDVNQEAYINKKIAIENASNDWCILFDSDNVLDTAYIDRLYKLDKWDENTAYCPDFAKPSFDYTRYAKHTITKANVHTYAFKPAFACLINTMNYFINRNTYLFVWKHATIKETKSSDAIFFNHLWLTFDKKLYVVDNLSYFHRIHSGSYYLSAASTAQVISTALEKKMQEMR